jgi:tetratricopeptide (TPR) repeat protein
MYKIIVFGLLLLISQSLAAQTTRNFAWYDKYTYELYQQKDWDKVITVGNEALKEGFDYFYLRLRLGIAYYEKAKYRSAIRHFERALKFNNGDPLTVEYLYFAYKFAGRLHDAGLVFSQNKAQAKSRNIKKPSGFITGIYSEAGLKLIRPNTPDFSPLKYFHFGVEHQLGSRLNLYQGYMRLSQNIYENSWYITASGRWSYTTIKTIPHIQNEYYAKLTIPVLKGWQFVAATHLQAISDSLNYNNEVFMAGFASSFKPLDLFAYYGWATVNTRFHQQVTVGVTFYPTMNLNLYLQTRYTYHLTGGRGNNVYYGKLGFRTGKNTWFELYSSIGDLRNVQEMNGLYFFNIPDELRNRSGVTSIFLLGKKVKLLTGYAAENLTQETTEIDYRQHYIFLGLQLQFKN